MARWNWFRLQPSRWLLVGLGWVIAVGVWAICLPAYAQENTVDYTYTNVSHRDFSHLNLSGTSFAAATARETNFEGSDLSQTILTKASFLRANLSEAILSESFADRVVFDQANLTNAIITDAIMTSTSFNDAQIQGADFSGSILDRYQVIQMCKYADGVNPLTGIATRDSLGCR